MKKLFIFAVCVAALVMLTAVSVLAEPVTFMFDSEESVKNWVATHNNKAVEYSFDAEHGGMKLVNTDSDPYVLHNFETPLDASEYTNVLYRFKIIDGARPELKGQFFFGTDTNRLGQNQSYTNFAVQNSNNWQEIVHDFSDHPMWKGQIKQFRLDHVDGTKFPVTVIVHSITFAKDKAEALKALDAFDTSENKAVAPQWILDSYTATTNIPVDQLKAIYENNEVIYESLGFDPKITFPITENDAIQCYSYPYIAFRMKTTTKIKEGGIFFTTNINTAMGKNFCGFEIKNQTGEWADYIIDMSTYQHGHWDGKLTALRLDPINAEDIGAKIQIDRLGIFATEQEAKDFLAKEVKINIIEGQFEEDMSKVINTGAKTPTWDMRTGGDKWLTLGGKGGAFLGMYRANAETNDMYIYNYFDEEDFFDGNEFHYFAMRYKTDSPAGSGALFFATDEYSSFTDDAYVVFPLNGGTGEWENLILDMDSTTRKDVWRKTRIRGLRIDPLNPTPTDMDVTINRIGVFRSRTEALEYLNGASDLPDYSITSDMRRDFCHVIIPGGTLSDGYNEQDYVAQGLNGTAPEANSVISYTDKDGNESIVALGYVNNHGYATYVADKAGTYKIASYNKDYVDTDSHWGKDYISFVSARKLFGGTSETEFSPDMPMTRGMFITVLGRMQGVDTAKYTGAAYPDVNAGEYYAPYIAWSKEYGILAPLSDVTFGAEDAIARKDMAAAIANYIKAYGHDIVSYASPVEFTDIAALTDTEKAAIAAAQSAGIINGKGDGIFDPMGVSTRAEVATVMQRVIKGILDVNVSSPYDADYFKRDRIRVGVWGYPAGLINEEGMQLLTDLGADLIISGGNPALLPYTDKYGVEVFLNHLSFSKASHADNYDYSSEISRFAEHPSFGGNYMTDEPGTDDFGWLGELAARYNSYAPDKTAFINLLPMYANAAQLKMGAGAAAIEYYDSDPELYRKYCQAWFENFDVDYICTDIYPLNWSGSKKVTRKEYVEYINQIATVARENDAEFWCCIQTFGWNDSKRTPNEQEYRWQCYSMLSFGCTAILLWNYTGYSYCPSLINPDTLEPTQAYYDCQPVMKEMQAISDVFVQYKNLGAYTVNCTDKTDYLTMTGEYKDFATIKSIDTKAPLLVGCFDKKDGAGKAFTITNMTDFEGNEGKTATVKVLLDTSSTVTSYYRGTPTVITPDAEGYYTFDLLCGDGVFVTVG